jgi:hypothetical protein
MIWPPVIPSEIPGSGYHEPDMALHFRRYRCRLGHEFTTHLPFPVHECLHTEPVPRGQLPDCDGHCKAPVVEVSYP